MLVRLVTACLKDAGRCGVEKPLFIFLGDLVDRGPDSAGVISFLRHFAEEHRTITMLGNHDVMPLAALREGGDLTNWAMNGGAACWRSYGLGGLLEQDVPIASKLATIHEALRRNCRFIDDARWLSKLPLHFEDEHRIFVHAGLRPGVALANQHADDLLWIREPFLRYHGSFEKLIVHGHTPTYDNKPDLRSNRVNLDTRAYSSNILTAAVFANSQIDPIAFLRTDAAGDHGGVVVCCETSGPSEGIGEANMMPLR